MSFLKSSDEYYYKNYLRARVCKKKNEGTKTKDHMEAYLLCSLGKCDS